VPDDHEKSAVACATAAHQGHAEAQFRLAVMHCTGQGVSQDLAQAVLWYRRAAEQGHRYAQYNLAVMLLRGAGTEPDEEAAFDWSVRAAEQGGPEAQILLGDLYATGCGVAADRAAARAWYQKAAAQGNAAAAAKLAAIAPPQAASPGSPDAEPVARRDRRQRADTIAIITMVYNESANLPIWLSHYRRMAPSANLFVIDHSSDDGSTEHLPGVNKIPLPRDELDERDRVSLVNSLQQGFLRYYDVVIYTDCDELIVPDPAKAATIEEHLLHRRYSYASPIGINIVHIVDAEPPIDFTRPLLAQRRYGQFDAQMCKPIITRIPLRWQPGFHSCNWPINVDDDLYLFHTKQIDKDHALRRQQLSRLFPWSSDAIAADHSVHHRYDDERLLRELFLDPTHDLRQQGVRAFAFGAEIARLREETRELSGIYHTPAFKGPIVEIPALFRAAF